MIGEMKRIKNTGTLYITATPIGNLNDISSRMIDTLTMVDLIAAEDTRHTRKLLAHLGISKPLIACHEHNESRMATYLCDKLIAGQSIALVTDAGTPAISDPGALIVNEALNHEITVVPIPGPSSLISALSVSGFVIDGFVFEGFLPSKSSARTKRWEELSLETRVIVLLEAPHRIDRLFDEMTRWIPSRQVVVCRELTKLHETILRGLPSELKALVDATSSKGEFTIVIGHGQRFEPRSVELDEVEINRRIEAGDTIRDIARDMASSSGMTERQIYRKLIEIKEQRK